MSRAMFVIAGALVIALVVWIARNTYWDDVKVPSPLKGEALTNPFYAAQRLTETLGGHPAWDRSWSSPSPVAVVVLSGWHWDLTPSRRETIERWVEAGGRLVVDSTLVGDLGTFEKWSGISNEFDYKRWMEKSGSTTGEVDPGDSSDLAQTPRGQCDRFTEERDGVASIRSLSLCDYGVFDFLTTQGQPEWVLRNERGAEAMRVRVGYGSVTVLNWSAFRYRELFDGHHAWVFVAATQFRRGDEIRFLSENDYPSLLALLWQHGGPAVILMLVIIALILWRGWVRFGPMALPLPSARRSLAEQIRGSGEFALRYGSGDALHGAVVRALNEAVARRVPGYTRLPPQEQTAALAQLTGFDRGSLAAAVHHLASRRAERLRNSLALLESARRRALTQHPRSLDGND